MNPPRLNRFTGLPLSLQIVGLLIGVLVVAQITTLGLTLLLPPAPRPEYSLDDIAAALRGARIAERGPRPLERLVQSGPPAQQGPGWLVSEESRSELARLLAVDRADVQLLFYTPLPFAGVVGAPPPSGPLIRPPAMPRDEAPPVRRTSNPLLLVGTDPPVRLIKAQYSAPPGERAFRRRDGQAGPEGRSPRMPGMDRVQRTIPRDPDAAVRPPRWEQRAAGPSGSSWQAPVLGAPRPRGEPGQTRTTVRDQFQAQAQPQPPAPGSPDAAILREPVFRPGSDPGRGFGPAYRSGANRMAPITPIGDLSVVWAPLESKPPAQALPQAPPAPPRQDAAVAARPIQVAPAPAEPAAAAAAETPASKTEAAPRLPVPAPSIHAPPVRGLFGLAPEPFIAGDFVAAYRTAPGQWVVVRPHPEPFPNSWQRRVLLWFAISLALIGPLGYLFARRLAQPLAAFAEAADQLGRDPTASVVALRGPAEVGKAARAFNAMQRRLKRYVDDRAGMMAAISHDLRTPLTRMRFRLENAPPDVRAGVLEDVVQMEQMIASFLAFMQESSASGQREKVDLRSIVECVIDDAAMVGGSADIEAGEDVVVEADILALKRVLANLVENAVKYGHSAQARLFTDAAEAVVEIADTGRGLPAEELEKVFQPFYRGPSAEAGRPAGVGLGLASSRATVRAHGGDIRLFNTPRGLVAQMRLPLSQGSPQRLAAE